MTTLITDFTPEQHDWTPIPAFERYAISRHGFIFDAQKERQITPFAHTDDKGKRYLRLNLYAASGKQKGAKLHRLLALTFLANPEHLPVVDHRDQDSLNNDLANLRWATCSQNAQNMKIRTTGTSPYHGVIWEKGSGKWKAAIGIGGKKKNLGRYLDELDAAKAYDRAALANGYLHHNGLIQPRLSA